ncbi:hypothetical protein SAMN05444166_4242 [Singulisphaera sp. GP187]|uniref:hypothetical protein n=1 Tax=Singulisphaera sp. GP187 TaxID=1882752 RepID=UPI0009288715|nr:hypothetical protein [Singulisphaera sp. GP187]SIO38110.1 hypothetical protein SAMN05444166_4242 [Singulisphaera sp. GP187]
MAAGDVKSQGIGFAATVGPVANTVAATRLPFISTGGVLSPAQIQEQVNAAAAKGDARVASEIRKLTGDMAGRGFSSSSPILAALRVGLAGQNLRATLTASSQIKIEAAKVNAEAVYQGQKAVSEQFIQQEQVLNDVERNNVTRQVGVLNAVFSMVGSAL